MKHGPHSEYKFGRLAPKADVVLTSTRLQGGGIIVCMVPEALLATACDSLIFGDVTAGCLPSDNKIALPPTFPAEQRVRPAVPQPIASRHPPLVGAKQFKATRKQIALSSLGHLILGLACDLTLCLPCLHSPACHFRCWGSAHVHIATHRTARGLKRQDLACPAPRRPQHCPPKVRKESVSVAAHLAEPC